MFVPVILITHDFSIKIARNYQQGGEKKRNISHEKNKKRSDIKIEFQIDWKNPQSKS